MQAQPEWTDYLRTILALGFVAGLIVVLGVSLKRTGLDRKLIGNKGSRRLKLVETLYLDPKHRLVIVEHGAREHLLLLGADGSRLIATSGKSADDA